MKISLKRRGLAFGTILLLIFTMILSMTTIVSASPPAGIAIYDCFDLQNMNDDLSGYYFLANDIDCASTSTWNGGEGFIPIGSSGSGFAGTLDGRGHVISNLYINRPDDYVQGLFSDLISGAKVFNLGLVNITITGKGYVGGITGRCQGNAEISCCYVESSVGFSRITGTLNDIGGLVGENAGKVYGCRYNGNVTGQGEVGGIAGRNGGEITLCHTVTTVTGHNRVGGLVGYNMGDISFSHSYGTINCDDASSGDAGGLVGKSEGSSATITDCFANAAVHGNPSSAYSDIGGLIGTLGGGGWSTEIITNCYSIGYVGEGYNTGGLVGINSGGTINNSFWNTETSGEATSAGGTGLTTVQMKQQTTYDPPWDFTSIWQINEGITYPFFKIVTVCEEVEPPEPPFEVGGDIFPMNKYMMYIPIILLAAALLSGTILVFRRKHIRN